MRVGKVKRLKSLEFSMERVETHVLPLDHTPLKFVPYGAGGSTTDSQGAEGIVFLDTDQNLYVHKFNTKSVAARLAFHDEIRDFAVDRTGLYVNVPHKGVVPIRHTDVVVERSPSSAKWGLVGKDSRGRNELDISSRLLHFTIEDMVTGNFADIYNPLKGSAKSPYFLIPAGIEATLQSDHGAVEISLNHGGGVDRAYLAGKKLSEKEPGDRVKFNYNNGDFLATLHSSESVSVTPRNVLAVEQELAQWPIRDAKEHDSFVYLLLNPEQSTPGTIKINNLPSQVNVYRLSASVASDRAQASSLSAQR